MLKKFLIGTFALAVLLVGVTTASAAVDLGPTTLRVGSSGQYVMNLQSALGVTPVDGLFGPMTKAKVMAFQASNGLVADGLVGPATKNAINAGTFSGTTCLPGQFDPMTGLPCGTMPNLPAGCTSTVGFSPLTGVSCSSGVPQLPAGCTSTVGFSPTTGQSCSGGTTPVLPGTEGSVIVDYDFVPADNLAINRGETKIAFNLKVKADNSNMVVNRLWLDINTRMWLSASEVALMDGSTVLASIPLSASTVKEITAGSAWRLEFNGLNISVPVNTTKVLGLRVTRPELTSANESVTVATSSTLRATDAAGFSTTYDLTPARTINLANVAASTGTLTATLNVNSPKTMSVSGLSTTASVLTPVKLMDVDLKATDGSINVTAIAGTLVKDGTCTAPQCLASVELRDGTNVLSSKAPTNADPSTFNFNELNIDINSGTTKTLSIWGQVNHIATNFVVTGDAITAAVTSVTATTGTTFANASISPTVTGGKMHFYENAPTFTLGTTSAVQVDGSGTGKKAGSYSLSFTVTAPSTTDIYVDTPATLAAIDKTDVTKGGVIAKSSSVSGATSKGITLNTYDKVAAGTSRVFTFSAFIPDGGAAGFTGIKVVSVKWTDVDHATLPHAPIVQTWGFDDFKTAEVYVTTAL